MTRTILALSLLSAACVEIGPLTSKMTTAYPIEDVAYDHDDGRAWAAHGNYVYGPKTVYYSGYGYYTTMSNYYQGGTVLALGTSDGGAGAYALVDSAVPQIKRVGGSGTFSVAAPVDATEIGGLDVVIESFTISGRGTFTIVDVYLLADGVLYQRGFLDDGTPTDSAWTTLSVDADHVGLDANDAGVYYLDGDELVSLPRDLDVTGEARSSLDSAALPYQVDSFATDGRFVAVSGVNSAYECIAWTYSSLGDSTCSAYGVVDHDVLTVGEVGRDDWNTASTLLTSMDGVQTGTYAGTVLGAVGSYVYESAISP
jgi:hypothetical protein